MAINPAIVSALSVLAGSCVGAMTPVFSNYVLQRGVTRRDLMNRERTDRQTLYSDFISEATRLYADASTHNALAQNDAVGLYALVSRIRLVAPLGVVSAAEDVARAIILRYRSENVTLEALTDAAISSNPDPLHVFSTVCREDLLNLVHWSS